MPTGKYPRNQTAIEYLESRSICRPDGCIVWIAGKTNKGYGLGNKDGIKTTAHRLSYLINVGEVPNGMEIDHLCKNTLCINPKHLEAVTRKVNIGRGSKAQQTHCVNGHKFTSSNTYFKKSNGCRVCRQCAAIRARKLRKEQSLLKGNLK